MELYKVQQLSDRIGASPQVINGWIRLEENPLPLAGESPRLIDYEVFVAWDDARRAALQEIRKATDTKKAKTNPKKQDSLTRVSRELELLLIQQRKVMLWCRGEGKGWALGKIDEEVQPWVGNYMSILKENGTIHGANVTSLLKEAIDGKLYFIDVDGVIAFLLGQIEGHPHAPVDENIRGAANSLRSAMKHVQAWKRNNTVVRNNVEEDEEEEFMVEGSLLDSMQQSLQLALASEEDLFD